MDDHSHPTGLFLFKSRAEERRFLYKDFRRHRFGVLYIVSATFIPCFVFGGQYLSREQYGVYVLTADRKGEERFTVSVASSAVRMNGVDAPHLLQLWRKIDEAAKTI